MIITLTCCLVHTDEGAIGALRAAKKRNKHISGLPRRLDPEHVLFDIFRKHWMMLLDAIESAVKGDFKAGTFIYGFKQDHWGLELENAHPLITEDIKLKAEILKQKIIANEVPLPLSPEEQMAMVRQAKEIVWHPKWHLK